MAEVNPEWVEKAARELIRDTARSAGLEPTEQQITECMGPAVRREARAAIAAVADDIRAQTLRDAADYWETTGSRAVSEWLRARAEEVGK